jgi:hypothetical protein
MQTREAMQQRLHEILRNMRDSYAPVRCLAIHPQAMRIVFGSQYECEKWAEAHQLDGVVISTRLPEGGAFFGGADVLAGKDDAIDAMLVEIERTQQASAEHARQAESTRSGKIIVPRYLQ